MSRDSITQDDLPFLFAPKVKQDLLSTEQDTNQERVKRVEKAIKQIGVLTYTRLSELVVTGFLTATEISFDASRYPEHYKGFGVTPENAPYSDASPEMLQGFDAMGDIFEISIGSGLVRVPLAVVEVMLKTEPVAYNFSV